MSSIHVARQPIFELGRGLIGYELLYRRDESVEHADGEDGSMSAEVIVTALLGMGLHNVAGRSLAFVNFSRGQLLAESWTLFDPAEVVIELLETVDLDDAVVDACRRMVEAGYRLALDDFVYSEAATPLLEVASIVKIDVLGRTEEDLRATAKQLKVHGVRLLAERVETAAVRDMCADCGFELFQGYLFSRPETLTKTDVSAGQIAIMRLLNLLQDPKTTDAMLDSAFQSDVALSYKLLRIVNAAAIGGRGITSIPHAVRLVGRQALHRWLAIILVASLGRKGDVSEELALTAITRAKMCEMLAASGKSKQASGSAFIVGLLSLLDVLLEVPMDKILARLELSDDIRGALVDRGGALGGQLQIVETYERADWDRARTLAQANAVSNEALPKIYIDAVRWAAQQIS